MVFIICKANIHSANFLEVKFGPLRNYRSWHASFVIFTLTFELANYARMIHLDYEKYYGKKKKLRN